MIMPVISSIDNLLKIYDLIQLVKLIQGLPVKLIQDLHAGT